MARWLLLGLTILAPSLGATLAMKLELDTLTDKADVVVRGKIDSKEARWDAAKTGIWTHHSVTATSTLKGEHAATIEFVTRGGTVGNKCQHVAGSGNFAVGDEFVFFLWRDDEKRLQLVGMIQGALAISEVDGVVRAKSSFTGLTLVDPKTLKPLPEADRTPLDFTLADLESKVNARIKPVLPAPAEGK